MNIVIRSSSAELAKELSLLTNAAIVKPSAIVFNKETASLTVPMIRRKYSRKRLFFGIGERFKLLSPDPIRSELLIRDVIEYRPVNRISLATITLLFGVKLEEHRLSFCSAEESKGITAFEAGVTIRSYDIELRDRV